MLFTPLSLSAQSLLEVKNHKESNNVKQVQMEYNVIRNDFPLLLDGYVEDLEILQHHSTIPCAPDDFRIHSLASAQTALPWGQFQISSTKCSALLEAKHTEFAARHIEEVLELPLAQVIPIGRDPFYVSAPIQAELAQIFRVSPAPDETNPYCKPRIGRRFGNLVVRSELRCDQPVEVTVLKHPLNKTSSENLPSTPRLAWLDSPDFQWQVITGVNDPFERLWIKVKLARTHIWGNASMAQELGFYSFDRRDIQLLEVVALGTSHEGCQIDASKVEHIQEPYRQKWIFREPPECAGSGSSTYLAIFKRKQSDGWNIGN